MHTRTYEDDIITAYANQFVWIHIDPTVSIKNEDVMFEYEDKLYDLNEILATPTAVFMDHDFEIQAVAIGKVEAEDYLKKIKKTLGE